MYNIKIGNLNEQDKKKIRELIILAFKDAEHSDGDEQNLVERLRNEKEFNDQFEVIVTTDEENNNNHKIIGYALLSEILIINNDQGQHSTTTAVCLAPIAVLPEYQRKGIGKLLMNSIESIAIKYKYPAISILGNPLYYNKFGYIESIKNYNINPPFTVPSECYLIKPLYENSLNNINGTIKYQKSFGL